MTNQIYKDTVGWGLGIWAIGYLLSIILFAFVPTSLLGWVIMPVGILITLWVLMRKISSTSLRYYALIAAIWTLVAIACDYLFLVLVFKPADGYYKLDVYLYYALTGILPIAVGWYKNRIHSSSSANI